MVPSEKIIKVTPYKNNINKIIGRLPEVQEMNRKLTQLRGLAEDELSQENLWKLLEGKPQL